MSVRAALPCLRRREQNARLDSTLPRPLAPQTHVTENDPSALLGQLRIDRDAQAPSRPRWPWALALAVIVAGVVLAVVLRPAPAVRIETALVESLGDRAGNNSVLDASGYVVARRQATVSSKVTGKVMQVLIEEGQAVEAGQVLARIDDSNAQTQLALAVSQRDAASAALREVRVALAEAERQLQRNHGLAQQKLIADAVLTASQAEVDQLRARLASTQSNVTVAERSIAVQQQLLDDTVVRAPFAGVITIKNAQEGEMISPLSAGGDGTRTGIGTLVDMDSLEVEVDVNENFINRVKPGQPVLARLNAYPDWKIPAEVIAAIPAADRSKATVKVRIRLQEKDARVIPDMGARVSFLDAEQSDTSSAERPRMLIPRDAVKQENDTTAVFVVRGDAVERRAVQLGPARGEKLEVIAGLSGGERLAVSELAQLADGSKVELNKD